MKNLDELSLSFPEMDQKRQESLLGGAYGTYYGDDRDDPTKNGGTLPGVTIVGYPTPPAPYPTPGFNTGGSSGDSGGGGGTGSSPDTGTYTTGNPLHPDMVNHLMNSTFKFDPKLLTADEKAAFEKVLQAIDSTQAGDKVLMALDDYYKTHPNAIKPSITHNAPDPGAEGTFRIGSQEYDFGALLNDKTTFLSYKLDTVAHEMYHNFQGITGQSAGTVNKEVDANLFAALVEKQANLDFGTSGVEKRIEALNPTTQAQKDFNAAWENFINNGDVSQDNYNKIVNNFLAGSQVGSGYPNLVNAPKSTDEPQFLKDLMPPSYPPGLNDGNPPSDPNPYQH